MTKHVVSVAISTRKNGNAASYTLTVQDKAEQPAWTADVLGTAKDCTVNPVAITVETIRMKSGDRPESMRRGAVLYYHRSGGSSSGIVTTQELEVTSNHAR
ncbi:hypothetical protein N9L26_00920 [Candidatus Pacebacteria bacterium]|nr:hypothetical protein [Candidatus Paceibacterota bacterium]